jgi:hypothetical protein
LPDNGGMNATETPAIPADVMADLEAVVAAVAAGKAPDPELARRVRERADRVREDVFRRHGLINVAVPAIRELRDQ